MHCCAAWEPVGQCFDQCAFESINIRGLRHIIASLTRESIAEREAVVHNLPCTQTEKDNALAKCRLSSRAWVSKKPTLCLHAVTDEEGRPLDDEDESGLRLCTNWTGYLRHGPRTNDTMQTILGFLCRKPRRISNGRDKRENGV